ncbi:DUF6170 family protein [Cognaticolwellia mytili]|uniref:DUF6170 family protein n=1 Tax=Cognaticolwellia mytili TaxID=1888913 RepID=UPI000A1772D6
MTIYFSSNKIPELIPYNLHQRQAILALAQAKLTAPEKLLLNIIKLILLIPPFLFIANLQGMAIVGSIIIVMLAYFTFLRPIMLHVTLKHLNSAINQYKKSEH